MDVMLFSLLHYIVRRDTCPTVRRCPVLRSVSSTGPMRSPKAGVCSVIALAVHQYSLWRCVYVWIWSVKVWTQHSTSCNSFMENG